MNKIKIIWKSNSKDKKYGYIRLSERLTEEKKTKITSLRLPPIHERHFDKKNQKVKKTHPNFIQYNNVIEETLKKYQKVKTTSFILDDKKSLRVFVVEKIIPFCKSIGTKQKYINVLNLLEMFNQVNYNKKVLLFKDINEDFINEWKIWLRTESGTLENSISYKTKTFKSFINKSIKQNYYFFNPHPFNNIKNKVIPTNVDFLDEEQIKSILYGKLYDVIKSGKNKGKKRDEKSRYKQELNINDIRNFFVFQFFTHGMRVSDLMTMRWNNLNINGEEIRLKKVMLKTKYPLNILIYYKPLLILFNYIPEKFISPEVKQTYKIIKGLHSELGSFSLYSEDNSTIDFDYIKQNIKIEVSKISPDIVKLLIDNENPEKNSTIKISLNEFDAKYKKIEKRKIQLIKKNINSSPYLPKQISSDIVKTQKQIENKIIIDAELEYLGELRKIIFNKSLKIVKNNRNQIQNLYFNLYQEMIKIVRRILVDNDYKHKFIFPILKDKDFENIKDERNFQNMNEYQYNKMSGRRSYYNNLLKDLGNQLGIPNLTSHKSRHSFTSLLIKKIQI